MNVRWKIALLTLLGFSTAACCSTKKASKKQDKAETNIEVEGVDNRIMLMYGVPMPDGSFPTLVDDNSPQPLRPGAPFPDGRRAVVMTEERALEILESVKAEDAAAELIREVDGVPFPDGRVAIVMTEERAAEIMKAIEEEEKARAKKEQQ